MINDDDVEDVDDNDVDDGGVAAATNTRAWIVTGVRAKAVTMHGGMPCSFPSGVEALALTSPFETVSVFSSPGVFLSPTKSSPTSVMSGDRDIGHEESCDGTLFVGKTSR